MRRSASEAQHLLKTLLRVSQQLVHSDPTTLTLIGEGASRGIDSMTEDDLKALRRTAYRYLRKMKTYTKDDVKRILSKGSTLTASEVINELEMRVAQLEKQAKKHPPKAVDLNKLPDAEGFWNMTLSDLKAINPVLSTRGLRKENAKMADIIFFLNMAAGAWKLKNKSRRSASFGDIIVEVIEKYEDELMALDAEYIEGGDDYANRKQEALFGGDLDTALLFTRDRRVKEVLLTIQSDLSRIAKG